MTGKELVSKWYFKFIIGLIGFGGVSAALTYTVSLYYNDLEIVKDVKELKEWKAEAESKVDDHHKHINDEKIQKAIEYQVGLRFNKKNKKLYWRDKNKEYREIFHDTTGDYYRNDQDKKVYINDRY